MDDFELAEPNLTPMLDVVFQLIMFFTITMNFISTGQVNPEVVLPVAQAAKPLDDPVADWVFLNMDKDGKLIGTAEDISTEARLKAYLQRVRSNMEAGKKSVNVVIVLRAHKDVPYQRVYEVLDSCSRVGYRAWQLRVRTGSRRAS